MRREGQDVNDNKVIKGSENETEINFFLGRSSSNSPKENSSLFNVSSARERDDRSISSFRARNCYTKYVTIFPHKPINEQTCNALQCSREEKSLKLSHTSFLVPIDSVPTCELREDAICAMPWVIHTARCCRSAMTNRLCVSIEK